MVPAGPGSTCRSTVSCPPVASSLREQGEVESGERRVRADRISRAKQPKNSRNDVDTIKGGKLRLFDQIAVDWRFW